MAQWRKHLRGEHQQAKEEAEEASDGEAAAKASSDCYNLPCGMSFIRRWTFFKFIPFCPTFLADLKTGQKTTHDDEDDVEGAGVTVKMKALE